MPKPPNRHRPLAAPLLALPGARLRKMFGGEAIYLEDILVLVLADSETPWNGLLFPAERAQHPAILAEFPFLQPHEVLPKWLFLEETSDRFEPRFDAILQRLLERDERFGVLPKPRPRKKAASAPASPRTSAPVDDGRPPHLR